MITYKKIIEDITTICQAHKLVTTVGFGPTSEISGSPTERSMTVWIQPTPCSIIRAQNYSNTLIQYKLDIVVLEWLDKELENRLDCFDDTFGALVEIIQKIGEYYKILGSDPQPFLENYDSISCGWIGNITIEDVISNDQCNLPFNEINI